MREMSLSHKQHPLRQGKSLAGYNIIRYVMAGNQSLMIGTSDVDACYERIKQLYPDAKLTKGNDFVMVEKADG